MNGHTSVPSAAENPFAAGTVELLPSHGGDSSRRWLASGLQLILISSILAVFVVGSVFGYAFFRGLEDGARARVQQQQRQRAFGGFGPGQPNQAGQVDLTMQRMEGLIFAAVWGAVGALGLFGQSRCRVGSPEWQTNNLVLSSVALGALAIVLSIVVGADVIPSGYNVAAFFVSFLLGSIGQICFLVGLARITRFLGTKKEQAQAATTVRWGLAGLGTATFVILLGAILNPSISGARGSSSGFSSIAFTMMGGFASIALIAYPVWLAKYFNLLTGFRSTVMRATAIDDV